MVMDDWCVGKGGLLALVVTLNIHKPWNTINLDSLLVQSSIVMNNGQGEGNWTRDWLDRELFVC